MRPKKQKQNKSKQINKTNTKEVRKNGSAGLGAAHRCGDLRNSSELSQTQEHPCNPSTDVKEGRSLELARQRV